MKKGTYEDQIRIEELEVYAHHGVYPEENEKGQHFYVNATLYTNTRPAGLADDLSLSTNYGEVCQFITEFMQQHTFQLIETVAERTAYEVLQQFPLVQGLDLEIRKPEAPIPLPFGSVSVAIHREWHEAYIAVGSNMGDSREHIARALGQLKNSKNIRVEKVSELLETLPYGGVEQENFVNGMFEIRTLLAPEELLQELHRIVVVCRSGALTVSEIAAAGLPALFVPFQHKDRQQYWNALPLEKAGAAKIIEQPQLSVDAVANTLAGWSRETLLTMAERARAASIPDATERVANEVSRDARA